MADFEVKTNQLKNCAATENMLGSKIHSLSGDIRSVANNLHMNSAANAGIKATLYALSVRTNEHGAKMQNLSGALNDIASNYSMTEMRISGHGVLREILEITKDMRDVITPVVPISASGINEKKQPGESADVIDDLLKYLEGKGKDVQKIKDLYDNLPEDAKEVVKKMLSEDAGSVVDFAEVILDVASGDVDLDTLESAVGLFAESTLETKLLFKIIDVAVDENSGMNTLSRTCDNLAFNAGEKMRNGDIVGGLVDLGKSLGLGIYAPFYGTADVLAEVAADYIDTGVNLASGVFRLAGLADSLYNPTYSPTDTANQIQGVGDWFTGLLRNDYYSRRQGGGGFR